MSITNPVKAIETKIIRINHKICNHMHLLSVANCPEPVCFNVEFALSGQLSILGVVRAQTLLLDLFLWPFLFFFTNPDGPHPGQIKKTPPAWSK